MSVKTSENSQAAQTGQPGQVGTSIIEYAYEIRIRNHKEEAVTVVVNEPIGGDWEILNSSFPAEKTAAFAARFNVTVAKDGEAVLSYRVRVKYSI